MAIIFVIIETSSALWPQKIWWNSHNYSTSTYIWKYISTGLKLEIIFQEELHAHTLSWQAEPSFVEEEAHPTEHSLYVWVLVASMVIGQVFQTLMGLWPLLNTLSGAKVMKNALLLSSYCLLLLFHSLVILLVWVSPLSCRKKKSSRLVQKRRTSGYEF